MFFSNIKKYSNIRSDDEKNFRSVTYKRIPVDIGKLKEDLKVGIIKAKISCSHPTSR